MGQAPSNQVPPAVGGQQEGRPGGDTKNDDGVTWWCKLLAKVICVVSGIAAMFLGLWACFTISPTCLVAGIFLMMFGFAIIVLEAPCCCQFLDFIQPITRFSERRSYWQKAGAYAIPPFVPFLLCHSLTVIFGCALLLTSGVVYGLLALGKKADRDTMMTRARGEDVEMKETLITSEVVPVSIPEDP
ncbi:calcium channel flower homolog [Aplysia californica]|uniref:Calcium channel flower homolog n=1 Tax=Aplysia californica TaxID=6500 RepID=A0ABM0JZ99_APLCA|nr:calcium channel flower homolog [Aplysia californica]